MTPYPRSWGESDGGWLVGQALGRAKVLSGEVVVIENRLAPLAWQAVRDGERVRGVLRDLGDDRWEVAEIEE